MSSPYHHSLVTPAGLIVDRHEVGPDYLIVHAHGREASGTCPGCGTMSSSVHSRYIRSPRDFPAYGRRLMIRLTARRFRCSVSLCDRKTFVEQFRPDVIASRARRTSRLDFLFILSVCSPGRSPRGTANGAIVHPGQRRYLAPHPATSFRSHADISEDRRHR